MAAGITFEPMEPGGCPPTVRAGAAFASTQWSAILAARTDSSSRRPALEALCREYWLPVYHFIRKRGSSPHDAQDLAQGFFMDLLESDFLDRADPKRGRFRGYLVASLKHYLADDRDRRLAQKRGGTVAHLSWDTEEAEARLAELGSGADDPSAAYDRSWALTLLARALTRLEQEQTAAGKAALFTVLKPFLSMPAEPGDYARLAASLGIRRTAVALHVHRLKRRYVELVRLEVTETVAEPGDVSAEMDDLLRALGGAPRTTR